MYRLRIIVILIILFHIGKIWSQDFDGNSVSSERASSRDLQEEEKPKQRVGNAKAQPKTVVVIEDADSRINHKRGPWSASMFNLTTSNAGYANHSNGQISAYNFIAVDYRLSYTKKVSVRPEFFWSGGGQSQYGEKKSEVKPGNIYLAYIDNEFGLIPSPVGDLGVKLQFRLYIPFSDYSKQQKTVTILEPRFQFYRPLGDGYQFTYRFHPRYYVQSQTAYQMKFDDGGTAVGVTPMAELEHYVEIAKGISRHWSFSHDLGFDHKISNSSAANKLGTKKSTQLYFRPGLNFSDGPISFKIGYSWVPMVRNGDTVNEFYKDSDSEYTFLAYIGF